MRPFRVVIDINRSDLVLVVELNEAFDSAHHGVDEAVETLGHGSCYEFDDTAHCARR